MAPNHGFNPRFGAGALYSYIGRSLIGIKNIDLPAKLRRSPKNTRIRKNKRILGHGLEGRQEAVDVREEFGHWEFELVIEAINGLPRSLLGYKTPDEVPKAEANKIYATAA